MRVPSWMTFPRAYTWSLLKQQGGRTSAHGLCRAPAHLLGGNIFLVRRDPPPDTEGVRQATVAIAPEHVGERHGRLRTCLDGPGERGVGVRHVQGDARPRHRTLPRPAPHVHG